MTNRKRFRILSRDGFACRYCGRKAPEVVLQVDHILARANGGSDDDTNLITSCVECNLGKMTAEMVIELPAPSPVEKSNSRSLPNRRSPPKRKPFPCAVAATLDS